jgi:hypothetical protein
MKVHVSNPSYIARLSIGRSSLSQATLSEKHQISCEKQLKQKRTEGVAQAVECLPKCEALNSNSILHTTLSKKICLLYL